MYCENLQTKQSKTTMTQTWAKRGNTLTQTKSVCYDMNLQPIVPTEHVLKRSFDCYGELSHQNKLKKILHGLVGTSRTWVAHLFAWPSCQQLLVC